MDRKIAKLMLSYELKEEQPLPHGFATDRKKALKFILAVVFAQGIRYGRIWTSPDNLEKRLSSLEAERIAEMDVKELEKIMFQKPALHRYRKIADWTKEACRLLVSRYGGDARRIWKDSPLAREVVERLMEFKGIKQKKAHMAVRMIHEEGVKIRSLSDIDVACDRHVIRVFFRTGLAESEKEQDVTRAARKANADFPGALDEPAWDIGINYCHPQEPECLSCPLAKLCAKVGVDR